MGKQGKKEKRIADLENGEKFFYESAIFEMGWNRIATCVKSFNPEFQQGKSVKFDQTGTVEIVED